MKRSELRRIIREEIARLNEGPIYSIGGGGMRKLDDAGQLQIVPNSSWWMGASSSPDHIIVTKANDNMITYMKYPYKKELRIDRTIGEDLIKQGTTTFLKKRGKYFPEDAAQLKKALAGGKPLIIDPKDYERVEVSLQGDEGVDVYGIAKAYGVAGYWDDAKNIATAEMDRGALKDLKKEKGIKILKIKKV